MLRVCHSPRDSQGSSRSTGADHRADDPIRSFRPHGFYQTIGKRVLDAAAALLGLILLSPLLGLIALAVKLESPGPVFYRSTRVGRQGRTFEFLKFRTMLRGADQLKAELEHLNEMDGPVFKIRDDPRVTRLGRLLRRTSLDELPQLVHVLRGEMSLVGPRPPIPEEVTQYEPWQRRRLSVTPGITCLWQVSGRNDIGFEEWMQLDMEYIDRLSLGEDLKILLLTVPAVLRGMGAS
jgi:lipopolysaccharide/colanic/teichoic acid biosynthesis glycosyltransferase